ncbi:phage portal protein family protein [Ruegeria arenilitoris]|uniref:phage portal protein family protein n=1 Tax=Ruegeria arenilitoris TaxID=1173585 RepID=UPI00147E2E8D|nr:DUF935 family protein [Ruegeria arenilitoris]
MAKKKTKKNRGQNLNTGGAVATVANDITIANYSDVLHPLDDTLIERGGGEGLKIYDAIERDTHAWSVLQKRKHKLIGREWIVEPGGEGKDDLAAADFIRDILTSLPFDQICMDLLDATLKGFSIAENVYVRDGRHIRPEYLNAQDQRRFVFDKKWQPRLLTWSSPALGEKLPQRKFVVHRFGVKGNNPYGLGMGTRLFWPVLFKRNGVSYWMHFLERFAAPIPVGKYVEGRGSEHQRELMSVLQMMNRSSAITVPIGTELESFEAKRSGTVDYSVWGKFWNTEMSKAVLGETLTTEMGDNGARAASETHADILDALVDSDGDLLSGTLNNTFIRWLCDFNYPNAALPKVWRPRPANEMAQEELKQKRAERRIKDMDALKAAREAGYEPKDIGAHMDGVFDCEMQEVAAPGTTDAQKKTPEIAFADDGTVSIEDLIAATEAAIRPTHEAWIRELKTATGLTDTADETRQALLDWQTRLVDEIPYAEAMGDALALAEFVGRAEVLDEDGPALSEPKIGTVTFKEAQEFQRQKVSLPSRVWTDTLHQAHDRAFVVAGADSVSLVEDLRGALDKAMNGGGGLDAFRKEFDEIVTRHGWDYNGGRNWRTRVIYDTNLRAAHQAGRLKQMRNPDVVKNKPYWLYVHAETREPKQPREEHMAWDGKVFMHDDPIWDRIYPPNGWKCSCGVRAISAVGLRRLGKDGPDAAPTLKMRKVQDPTTGEQIEVPEGIDFGWGYQPGNTWERGIVPRELQKPLALVQPDLPLPVSPPLEQLGREFTAPQLAKGEVPEFYVRRFLQRFGADIGRGTVFRDRAGQAVVISDQLFRNADSSWKVLKFGREIDIERLAEAIFDPDEIWVDWEVEGAGHTRLVRRYLRWHSETSSYSSFVWNTQAWHGMTSFAPRKRGGKGKPDKSYIEKHRRGALIFRRE